jgi:hypothetical protein
LGFLPSEGTALLRLSRLKSINEIEAILNSSLPAVGQRKWKAKDAECRLDRHVFLGEHYSIHTNVLNVRHISYRTPWRILIVSDFWEDSDGQTIHSTKWLKLLEGKSADLLKWIKEHRDLDA